MSPIDWSVGSFWCIFWLIDMGGSAYCGWYHSWTGSSGCCKKEGWETHGKKAQYSSMASVLVPVTKSCYEFLPWLLSVMECDLKVVSGNELFLLLWVMVFNRISRNTNWEAVYFHFRYLISAGGYNGSKDFLILYFQILSDSDWLK